jgi:hypothetical protein
MSNNLVDSVSRSTLLHESETIASQPKSEQPASILENSSDDIHYVVATIRSFGSLMLLATAKIKLIFNSINQYHSGHLNPASKIILIRKCRERTSFNKMKSQRKVKSNRVRSMRDKN